MNRKTLIIISILMTILFGLAGCNTPNSPTSADSASFQAKAVGSWSTSSLGGFSNVAVYTPSTLSSLGTGDKQGLLIVLHGCTQSYTAYTTANLEDAAEQYGLVVAAPDAMYKAGYSCWDYWGATKSRTSGDYKLLIQLAQYFTANTNVDPNQVYIAGLSSGGAFAMITACLAPDIFAGMGIMAGPSAGTSSNGAFSHEGTVSSTASACLSYAGSYASYFDTQVTVTAAGTSDYTVPQTYAAQNAEAMAVIYENTTAGVNASTSFGNEKLWTIGSQTVISQLTLTGVAHAWPGSTGASGSYIDSSSINFGVYIAEFFKNNNRRVPTDTTAPAVSITSPSNGSSVSGTVSIAATASDDSGVAKVEFYVNGVLKATDTTSPYSYSWDTSSLYTGTYTLVAKAYDTIGNSADASVSVSVQGTTDSVNPSVSVTAPTSGSELHGTVAFTASASDAQTGVAKVEFYVDGNKVGEDTTSPYSIDLDTTQLSSSSHSLTAKATDGAQNYTISSAVSVTVNQIVICHTEEISATATSHYVAGRLDVTGYTTYGAEYGYSTAFMLYHLDSSNGGAWVDIHDLPAGCSVEGQGGGETDTTPPTVNVTAPLSGVTAGTITITADASDNVGVTSVAFYANGSLIGTDTTAPYSISYTAVEGTLAIKAIASDAAGNTATDDDTTVAVTAGGGSTTTTVSFDSISADDGYVKAYSGGTSPAVGTYTTMAIGRGTDSKFNRAILSFDTSSLPDTANIVRAYVVITYSSKSGDPWANGNTMVVDVKSGLFGSASTTETADWAATATADAVATIASFSSGTKQSADFSSAGLAAISKTTKTQMKLRFSADQTSTAYIFITQGSGAKLYVEYE